MRSSGTDPSRKIDPGPKIVQLKYERTFFTILLLALR